MRNNVFSYGSNYDGVKYITKSRSVKENVAGISISDFHTKLYVCNFLVLVSEVFNACVIGTTSNEDKLTTVFIVDMGSLLWSLAVMRDNTRLPIDSLCFSF